MSLWNQQDIRNSPSWSLWSQAMGRERGLPKVDRNEPMIKFLRDKNLLCQLEPGAVSAPAYTGGFYLSDTAPGSNWHTSQTLFSDTCETPLSSSHSRPLINSSTKKNQRIESRYYILHLLHLWLDIWKCPESYFIMKYLNFPLLSDYRFCEISQNATWRI